MGPSPSSVLAAPRRLPPRARERYPGEFLVLLATDHLALFRRLAERDDVARIRIGPQRLILLNHPDDIQRLLVTDQKSFTKGRALDRVKMLLGEGLLTNEGASHLRQRRIIQPSFHRDRIAAYAGVMAAYTDRAASSWRDGMIFDIHEAMMRLTRDIAGKTLFDLDVGDDPGGVSDAITLSLRLYRWAVLPFGELSEHMPIPFVRRVQRARARLNAWLMDTIHARRTERASRGDLLSLMIETGEMDDRQLRDEAITLFVAGHETTAVALSWTWYLLSQHPAVERALHAELDRVLGGAPPTVDDVPRLPYTRLVLNEAFRLYPPAWIMERRAVHDVEFQGYRVPAGSLVFASQYLVHRDARWFEQPERFDPERWRPERTTIRPKFSYFPFGGGTRICVGEQFAWMEATLILATIAQRWRLRHAPEHVVAAEPLVTLRPKHGMRMILTRREVARPAG